jgi:hypothetical protein
MKTSPDSVSLGFVKRLDLFSGVLTAFAPIGALAVVRLLGGSSKWFVVAHTDQVFTIWSVLILCWSLAKQSPRWHSRGEGLLRVTMAVTGVGVLLSLGNMGNEFSRQEESHQSAFNKLDFKLQHLSVSSATQQEVAELRDELRAVDKPITPTHQVRWFLNFSMLVAIFVAAALFWQWT